MSPSRVLLAASVVVPLAFASGSSSAAEPRSKRYEVAGGLRLLEYPLPDFLGVTSDGSIEYGAVHFEPVHIGQERDVTATVVDDANPFGQVFTIMCADIQGNGQCDPEQGDPRVSGCVPGDGSAGLTLRRAPPDVDLIVRVFALWGCDVLVPDVLRDPAAATTGVVTITDAPAS